MGLRNWSVDLKLSEQATLSIYGEQENVLLEYQGSGPEIENMVFSNGEEGDRRQEDKKQSVGVEVNGEVEKGSGVIGNFISAFVSSRGKDDQETEENEQVSRSEAVDEENKEEKEGGLLNHLISMVTPNQHGENGINGEDKNQEKVVEDEEGGGGGVIHNFISNILHPSNGENNKVGEDKQVIEDGGGEKIVENSVSHLPIDNDGDDHGTETGIEEASMLIHSIVHD